MIGDDAEAADAIWQDAPHLSLTDGLCLALGQRLDTEVLIADTVWSACPEVALIR